MSIAKGGGCLAHLSDHSQSKWQKHTHAHTHMHTHTHTHNHLARSQKCSCHPATQVSFFHTNTFIGIRLSIYTSFLTPYLAPPCPLYLSICLSLSDYLYWLSVCVLLPLQWRTLVAQGAKWDHIDLSACVNVWLYVCLWLCVCVCLCMWDKYRAWERKMSHPVCHNMMDLNGNTNWQACLISLQ